MENKEKTEVEAQKEALAEEAKDIALAVALAGTALAQVGKPAIIVIGTKDGMITSGVGKKEQFMSEDTCFTFRLVFGLLTTLNKMTDEERDTLLDIATKTTQRKCAELQAERTTLAEAVAGATVTTETTGTTETGEKTETTEKGEEVANG